MKRHLLACGASLALLATAANVQAAVVNIDFGLHPDHPTGPTSVLYTGTAAAPDAGTVWNGVQVTDNNAFHGPPGEFGWWSASVSQSNLLSSTGAPTPIGVNVVGVGEPNTGAFAILEGSPNLGAVATDAVGLMRDYLIGFNEPRFVNLSGFAPGTSVDLYLYGAGDTSNRDTMFSVTDVNGTHTATTTGTITGDGNNPVTHTLTLGGDYVILNGILADANGGISISYLHGAGSGEGPFNGLQAVYNNVPEPTSLGLAGAGLCALLLRRRR
ncbi:PEP-CTERM sorting domain-containing protein [Lacipirellula sp.]|uniref:PEP-CTERM sorting domain-containing protein n=1 Tax=Lacipirellula sp. TaxID=2691419 RepID=UPI003D110B13